MTEALHKLARIAGVCAILAPLPLLVGDIMQIIGGLGFEWTIMLWVAFVLFVPAILGLVYLLVRRGSRLALIGGAFAYFGAMAGASMQVLFRVRAVLEEAGAQQTIEQLRGNMKLVASTQMIGVAFPIGLILLAVALYRTHTAHPAVALALTFGAILFPMGRIAGLLVGLIGGDLLLWAAFGVIGTKLLAAGGEKMEMPIEGTATAQSPTGI